MKFFIPSYGRAETIKTHVWLPDHDVKIVLHNELEKEKYLEAGRVPEDKIIVSNTPLGIAHQRKFIWDSVEEGEWLCMLDDNIEYFTAVGEPHYSQDELPVKEDKSLRNVFERKIDFFEFQHIIEDTLKEADRVGARMAGFASNPNFFFRGKKFRHVGFILGKTMLFKKNNFVQWDTNIQVKEDYQMTAENLFHFGCVVINNFAIAKYKHYQKGGCGTFNEREQKLKEASEYLVEKYKGLFRYKKSTDNAEIQVCFKTRKQVENWRKQRNLSTSTVLQLEK